MWEPPSFLLLIWHDKLLYLARITRRLFSIMRLSGSTYWPTAEFSDGFEFWAVTSDFWFFGRWSGISWEHGWWSEQFLVDVTFAEIAYAVIWTDFYMPKSFEPFSLKLIYFYSPPSLLAFPTRGYFCVETYCSDGLLVWFRLSTFYEFFPTKTSILAFNSWIFSSGILKWSFISLSSAAIF